MIQPNSDFLPAYATATERGIATDGSVEAAAVHTAPDAELKQLVTRAQSGDSPAQTELVRLYRRRVAGLVRTMIRQSAAIDDVTQMAFIKMFRHLHRLRDVATFESWLFAIVRNTGVDFIRHQRRRPQCVTLEGRPDVIDGGESRVAEEIRAALDHALDRLKPVDRRMVASFVSGESYRSIAAQNGCSIGNVKIRLHRVRPFLRACVGELVDLRPRRRARPRVTTAGWSR